MSPAASAFAPPAGPTQQQAPQFKREDVSSLADLLATEVAGRLNASRDRPPHMGGGGYGGGPAYGGGRGYGGGQDFARRGPMRCFYCGKPNCDTKICPEVMEDIRAHKIRRDGGQIVLFDGRRLAIGVDGMTLREQVNAYCDQHPETAPRPVDQLLLEVVPNWPGTEADLDDSDVAAHLVSTVVLQYPITVVQTLCL